MAVSTAAAVHIEYVTRSVAKGGNRETENEDAVWPDGCDGCEEGPTDVFRCAIADGATQAAFSGEWAQKLVQAYVSRRLPSISDEHLTGLRKGWNEHYRSIELPWYLEEKVLRGGFAAFLGLEIRAPIGHTRLGNWRATAVGDCCLFSVRRDCPSVRFPFRSARELGNTPYLISTNAVPDSPLRDRRKQDEGHWRAGDTFYLMSDALAGWFLSEAGQANKPWRRLDKALDHQTTFEEFVSELRADGQMTNDDTTVARVRVR